MQVFQMLDLNGDGLLTLDELQVGYNKTMKGAMSNDEIKDIF